MQTPEEVAREVLGCCLTLTDDGRSICETEHGGEWDCADEEQRIADLIRARDAEALREAAEDFATGGWHDAWMTDRVDDDVSAVRSTDKWLRDRADQIEKEGRV